MGFNSIGILLTYCVLLGPFISVTISMVTGILEITAGLVGLVHLIVNQSPVQVSFGIVRLALQALIEIRQGQLIFIFFVIGVAAIVVGVNPGGIQPDGLAVVFDSSVVLL